MNGCWRISSLWRAGGNCETRILGVGGEECVLTELKISFIRKNSFWKNITLKI